MVNFAELRAKAEKAKDAGVTKVTNTRDRYSSVPSSKANWDPNWKRAPPPPPGRALTPTTASSTSGPPPPPMRSRPESAGSGLPTLPRTSRPTDDVSPPPLYIPPPPPTRAASGYPPSVRETSQDSVNKIDWANLSSEDKDEFFRWLDEFFSRSFGIELSPRERKPASSAAPAPPPAHAKPPLAVNLATRPRV